MPLAEEDGRQNRKWRRSKELEIAVGKTDEEHTYSQCKINANRKYNKDTKIEEATGSGDLSDLSDEDQTILGGLWE